MSLLQLNPRFATTRIVLDQKLQKHDRYYDNLTKDLLFLPYNPNRKGEGGLRTRGYFKISDIDVKTNDLSWNALKMKDAIPTLVTVITVVFNGESFLEQTIQSVINQTYDNIEYIVIDGGSTDNTLNVIRKYDEMIDYWVSEADCGLYYAMNKAIKLSTGEFVGIINSGDWYELDAVESSILILNNKCLDYVYGNAYLVNNQGNRNGIFSAIPTARLNKAIYYVQPYPHVSAFIKRSVYLREKLFNTSYTVSADHEFSLRMYTRGYKGFDIGRIVASVRPGGLSGTLTAKQESRNIAISYGKSIFYAYLLYFIYNANGLMAIILPQFIVNFLKKVKSSRFKTLPKQNTPSN